MGEQVCGRARECVYSCQAKGREREDDNGKEGEEAGSRSREGGRFGRGLSGMMPDSDEGMKLSWQAGWAKTARG